MRRFSAWYLIALLGLLAAGCGMEAGAPPAQDWTAAKSSGGESTADDIGVGLAAGGEAASSDKASLGEALPPSDKLQRKIIYTAEVDLVVEDFDPIPAQVDALVKKYGGYVARSQLSGSSGYQRSGSWTLRVPVENYEACLTAARTLGEVRSVSSDSQDVSEEFYDIEARLRNKRDAEARLLRHLDESTGKLSDILDVEREIDRVRGEIERMEGRLRVLTDLTSLTTIVLSVQEIRDYVPEEAPTYLTRVRRAFSGSVSSLVSAAQAVSIAVVAAAPWLPVVLVVCVLALWLLKLCWRLVFGRRA